MASTGEARAWPSGSDALLDLFTMKMEHTEGQLWMLWLQLLGTIVVLNMVIWEVKMEI